MEKVLLFAILLTVLFGLMKMAEMKYIDGEIKPLKELVRDLVMVFASSVLGGYVFILNSTWLDDILSTITNTKTLSADVTQVFTGAPDF